MTLVESSPLHTLVALPSATDSDAGENGRIVAYKIEESPKTGTGNGAVHEKTLKSLKYLRTEAGQ